jgi:hypothetical protein
MATRTRAKDDGRTAASPKDLADFSDDGQIALDAIAAETLSVPIIGTTELIQSRFSEKAKRQMLDAMQGRKTPKAPKDPQAEYEAAFYRLAKPRRGVASAFGIPVMAFKQATVGAARFYGKDVSMVSLKQSVFMRGEMGVDGIPLTRITGEPRMREDVVRLGRSGTDLRYRPGFPEWSCTLTVTYVTAALTRGSLLSLIDAGGMGVGVQEWRPERNGDFGTYRIDPDRKVEVVQ